MTVDWLNLLWVQFVSKAVCACDKSLGFQPVNSKISSSIFPQSYFELLQISLIMLLQSYFKVLQAASNVDLNLIKGNFELL